MSAGTYNITIEQGTDFLLLLTWKDANGNPIDITGWSAALMVRWDYSDFAPLVSISSPGNGITLGGTAGTIAIDIPMATTAALVAGLCVYDLKMIDPFGKPLRLLQGSATVSPAVTR